MTCGPTDDGSKERDAFLAELIRCAPPLGYPWLIDRDFNVIYEARNKSNCNLNMRIMGTFRDAIDTAPLREIKCKNRRFTWRMRENHQPSSVLTFFFANSEWEAMLPSHLLMVASSSCSDHCP